MLVSIEGLTLTATGSLGQPDTYLRDTSQIARDKRDNEYVDRD